jgi:hypothetical protein
MTVSGVAVAALWDLALTRNRCPSLVTEYICWVLKAPVANSLFGNPGAKASDASIGTAVIAPLASR